MILNRNSLRCIFLGAVAFALVGAAHAAVITSPAGLLTGTPLPGASDPLAADTWMRANVRTGSTAGITADYPRSTGGSAYLSASDGAGKADWVYYKTGGFGPLSSISSYSYEWYRAAASTAPAHLHPVMRLIVDIDGNPATTTDIASLVFERAYNPSVTPVPLGTWTQESISASTNLWVSQSGVGNEPVFNRTLADYQAGTYTPTAGWTRITGNSLVIGMSLGIGSGWNGSFQGAVDNPTINGFVSNFELVAPPAAAAVPVPAMGLLGLLALSGGVAAAAAVVRRRKA